MALVEDTQIESAKIDIDQFVVVNPDEVGNIEFLEGFEYFREDLTGLLA